MFKNYLKIALKNMYRNKLVSIINIVGLSVGMAATILLMLYVIHELSYDRFHENPERIYRVVAKATLPDGKEMVGPISNSQVMTVLTEVPEITAACKLMGRNWDITYNNVKYIHNKMFWTDTAFFKVFSFPVLEGDVNKALLLPNSIVLTRSVAKKIFGDESPINKFVQIGDEEHKITAVIEDVPKNSHFTFEVLASFTSKVMRERGQGFSFSTYFRINDNSNIQSALENAENACKNIYKNFEEQGIIIESFFQPLLDIHLHSDYQFDIGTHGRISYIYIFSSLAAFILLIAIINFVNLSTAKSENRAKDIGMRKVVGASRLSLIGQFIGESVIITLISMIFTAILVNLFAGRFSQLMNREISVDYLNNFGLLLGFIALAIFVGIIAGAYPAFYLAKFDPVKTLKGRLSTGKKDWLRITSVIVQFSITVFMITCLIILYRQVNYMKYKELGFNDEQVITFSLGGKANDSFDTFKSQLVNYSGIESVTMSTNVPGRGSGNRLAYLEGTNKEASTLVGYNRVRDDYIKTYGMKIIFGRDFDKEIKTDDESIIINEAALKVFGLNLESAIGKNLIIGEDKQVIIGVLKDYHYKSLHSQIEPMTLTRRSGGFFWTSVKIKPYDVQETLDYIKKTARNYDPDHDFGFIFIDDEFRSMYQAEESNNQLILLAGLLAILLSALGLFALTSHIVTKRTKEIGIRKVLGASESGIVVLLSNKFIRWVLIASVIAWPASYYAMNQWLQNFAYKIDIGFWTFILAGVAALIIALATVSYQTGKAARENPVESLKYE